MLNVYPVNSKKSVMKEELEDDLMSFEMPEEYDDNNIFTEELNDDISQELQDVSDDSEEVEDEEDDITKNKNLGTTIVKILRNEIKTKKEYERDFLRFRYRGEICDGIPMTEINPSRFVFKIDNILKAINLSEIKIL